MSGFRHGLGQLGGDQYQDHEPAEINLAPMIDILFILLIFFLVTSTFVREAGVEVQRPDAASATSMDNGAYRVAIRANGELWVDGHAIDLRRLRAEMARLHAKNRQAPVILQADQNGSVGLLVKVMDQIRQAGISDIAIAAEMP
jgi:biopolymer transport protein ExbD